MAQNDTPKTNVTTDEDKKPKAIDHSQYTKIGEPTPIDHSQYTKIEKTKTQNFLADPATSLMSGLASVPDIAIGLADIVSNGRAGKAIEDNTFYKPGEASKYWNNQKSDVSKSQVQQRQDIDGIGGKLKSALSNPSTIANTVVESLPSMLTGGVIGRGISAATKVSGVAGGAIGEGAVMAGQQAEQIRQQTDDRLLTNTQSGAALATGALGTLFGYAGGKIAHKYGFGDVDTLMASGRASQRQTANEIAGEIASTPAKSIPRKVIEGAITEGFLEELPQSVSEQILQNLALNKEWSDGVADAAVMGTLAGMAMGAGAGSFGGGSKRSEITAPPVVDDEAPNAPINPNGINGIGGNELPQDSASINQQGADTTPADLSAPIEPPNAVNTNSDPSQSLGNTQPDSAQVPADQQQSEVQPEVQPEVATPNAAVANFDPTSALSMLAEAKRRKDAERNQSSQAPVAPKPSEQMGLNPDNGPMSAAAALAVDSGAAPSIDPTTGTPLLNAPESTLSDAAALASGEQQAKPTNEQYQSKLGELDQQRSQFEQAGDYDSATKIYDQMQQLSREWQASTPKTDAAPKADYKKTESDAAWTDYYNTNRNNIGDDLFTGGYEDRLALESAPEDLRLRSAHGMAKSSSGNAISDLKDLLNNGIDPSRGDGRLFTAPLSNVFANEEDRQAASVSGTSSGSAYSDGAFTLVAKNGVGDIQNMSEVDAVMVNSAVPNAVVDGLRKDFPSMKFGYADELPTLLGSNVAAQQDGVGIAQTASATEQATQDKQNTAPTIDAAAQAETGKPINLVRHSRAEFDWNRDKPQGTYASIVDDPTNFESPFEEEGQRFDLEYTPKNALTVDPIDVAHARFGSRKKGVASAGVAALSKLLSKADFDAALALNKEQAIAAVNKKFPSVDTSRVHDAYEALEVWGAQEAKKAGHDVIIGRHKKLRLTPNEPDFSEAVLLTGSGKPKAAVPATAIASLEAQLANTASVAEKAKIRKEINAAKADAEQAPEVKQGSSKSAEPKSINQIEQLEKQFTLAKSAVQKAKIRKQIDDVKLQNKQHQSDYIARKIEVLEALQDRGEIEKLAKEAGVRKAASLEGMPASDVADAYVRLIERGDIRPVEFNEDYNSMVMRKYKEADVSRKQAENTIVQANGRPFKTEKTAAAHQAEYDLTNTHEIKAAGNGFALQQLPLARQAELRDKANGIKSYMDIQSEVLSDMGIKDTGTSDIQATEEQWVEIDRRIDAIERKQRGLPPKQEQISEPEDKIETVVTPEGIEFEVRHKIVEADDLITSNTDSAAVNPDYPKALQPRDRTTLKSITQINEIVSKFNPILLGSSASTTTGAPIVASDNVVESGNGRTLAIRKIYQTDKAAPYKAWLTGQGYDIANMRQPVLVRERTTPMTMAERVAYATASNVRDTLDMSASEQAMSDAPKVMDILHLVQGGSFNNTANRDFVNAFLTGVVHSNERGTMLDKDGLSLTQDGYRRIESALLAAAFNDSEIITQVIESKDGDIKAIGNALIEVAPKWAQVRKGVEDGVLIEGVNIEANLAEAVHLVRKARQQNISLLEVVSQDDIFEGELDQATKDIISIFYSGDRLTKARSGQKVAEALNAYAELAMTAKATPNLFGDAPLTNDQILGKVNERLKQGEAEKQQDLLSSPRTNDAITGAAGEVGQRPSTSGTNEAAPQTTEVTTDLGLIHSIPSKLMDTSHKLGDVVKDLAAITTTGAEADNKYAKDLLVTIAKLNPDVQVHIVSDLNNIKDNAIRSNLAAGGFYVPEENTAYFYPKSEDWTSSALELINHELVHSVTEQSITNGLVSDESLSQLNRFIEKVNAALLGSYKDLSENVNDRLVYLSQTNPIHEVIAAGVAESEVRQALNSIIGTDGLQQLDAIFTKISTKQAQANEQRKQSGNTKNGAKNVSGSLPVTKQDTAAAVQGLPAEATGNQDNTRGARPDTSDIPTDQEESGEVTKPEVIRDFGEKIGGARKDSATNTGSKSKSTKQKDLRPTWAKRFEITQIVASSNSDEVGRWVIDDTRKKDWKGNPKRMGASFATQQEAEEALVLVAVGQKHRVIASRTGSSGFEIWRTISDRKGVKVVDQVFTTRDEALRYMVDNAQTIIETNTTFGEIDLPRPDDTVRKGVKRRDGAAKDSDFIDVFGFRGVEFGNWNNQEERQQLLNDAYDGLLDLADVLGVPPKALSLNGDLALAFGARGQGLSSARAHYEPEKVVINLTKMNGAGSLAHEWWHAFDHYLARQDGKASGEWIVAKDGTRSFKISTNSGDNMVSSGFSRNKSGVREDVREAYNKLMQTIFRKSEQYVEDTVRADDFVGRTKEQVVAKLTAIRKDLSEQKDVKYYKRHNKPASAEQLVEFDTFAQQIMDGIALATEWRESGEKKSRSIMSGMRWTNDALEKLSQIIKAVRGRSGFTADQKGTLDSLRSAMNQYSARLKMLADAQSGDPKVRFNPTEFAMSAKELDQGRGTNYWTTPHEMIARAFQGYVEDQIAKKKGSSPFLNYAPESAAIMTPWGWKRPYPHGSERKAINQTFDNLVDALETKETPEGTALYSRKAGSQKTGLSVKAARTALVKRFGEAVIAKLERDGKLRIVDQLSNLPSDALNSILAFHGSPFKFEKFSLDHLGRGDGQQLYGHGLYFSDSKAVSDFYRKNLAKRGDSGQLYQVNINSESKDILQWEEPLSHQQEILSRLKPLKDHLTSLGVLEQYETMLGREFNDWNGGELYTVLKHAAKNDVLPQDNLDLIEAVEMGRHQKAASLYLNQLGINGLKYSQGNLDGTKSTGDSNYVIFDDSAIEIVDTFYSQNSTGIEGYYHNGEVVLIASNLTDDTVIPTFLHELGGHAGFQNMMQPEQYAELMRQFDRMVKQGNPIALEAQKLAMRESNKGTQQLEMLPYLLSLAANPNVKNAIHKNAIKRFIADLISKVKAWVFDKLGVNLTLTPNDMVALAERMVKQAANGNNINSGAAISNGDSDASNPDILFSRGFADNINDLVNNLNKEGAKKLKGRLANSMQDWLDAGLALLGRRQLVDIYSSLLPQLTKYNQLAAQMDADQNDAGAKADNIVRAWSKLKDEQALAELMHDATLAQIDPAKPRVKTDNVQKYLALKNAYDKLTPEAKEIYLKARDAYKDHYNAVHGAIKERILRSELSSQKKADLMKQMDANFFGGLKGVYFPLARFGKYTVIVRDANGDVQSVSRAETKNEAVKTRNELIKLFPSSEVSEVILEAKFQSKNDSVSRGFMAELFNEVDNLGLSSKDKADFEDTLNQLYLSSLPDLSWAKHGIHRKGTPGFSQNARRAFAQNMFHGASYLSKVRYADQLADELDGMKKHADANKNDKAYKQNIAQAVIDEMNARHENMMNPKSSSVSSALTSLGFIYFLGLSPASAIVNIMQTPLVAFPVLGAKWGFDKASGALLKASSDYMKGLEAHKVELNGLKTDFHSLMSSDISKGFSADEKAAYLKAVDTGVIDVTQAHDLAGIAQGEDSGVMWKTRPVMRAASFMFHHAERFNREVTFIAAFRLATQAGTAPDLAYKQAVDATYKGHFDYSAGNRPRFMQGNAAKVLFLFKQFGQNMIYTIARETYQSFAAKTQAEKVEARRTIGSLLAMHAVAAGVLGLPLVTTLLALITILGGAGGGGDDEPWDAEVALRNYFADAIGAKAANILMKGASRATPFDISGRVGLDHLVFPSIQSGLEGTRLSESILAASLGPVAGIGTNFAKGAQEIGDGRYMEGLEQMLPVSLKSPLKSYRYATEGVQDRTGISVMDEVSAMGVTSQAFGFSPSDVRTKMEGKSAIYQDNKRLEVRRKELMAKWTRAMRAEDNAALDKAWEAIDKFNSINPDRTITPKNLTQSYRGTDNRIARAENGIYLAPSKRGSQQAGRFAFDDSGE